MCSIPKRTASRLWLFAAVLVVTATAQAKGLVIFGDSLSDTGNKYAVNGMLSQPPYDTLNEFGIPTHPYARGGKHFTNGKTWIEWVARSLHQSRSAKAVLRGKRRSGNNYAWGGAHAYPPANDDGNRHLGDQVAAYLADVNFDVDPKAIHVVFIGGNDLMDALSGLGQGGSFPEAVTRVALAAFAVQENVNALRSAGAQRFLLLNAPNVGLVPALSADPQSQGLMTCFAILLNTGGNLPFGCPQVSIPLGLHGVAANLRASGAEVTTIDVFSFISALAGGGQGFGFTNVTQMCVRPNQPPYACSEPNEYLFWDGIHPTKAVHRLLASVVLNALEK